MRFTLLLAACCLCLPVVLAQPTPCPAELRVSYDGPCYYGALPAFFDDFAYDSARTTGSVADALGGDLFGANVWNLRQGKELTRAWYRFNRDDLPILGSIRFGDSVMRMRLPAGISAEAYPRSMVLLSSVRMREGTYHWRIRLGKLWHDQDVRQAIWTISPTTWLFTRGTPTDSTRYIYWSELDFENENHFQGEHRDGKFHPDYSARMSVTNHVGLRISADGHRQRLSHAGSVVWSTGSSALVRSGFARRAPVREAPLVHAWEDMWWSLMIHVDSTAQTVTYHMVPESDATEYDAVARRTVTFDEAFYPRSAMAAALSLHWISPKGVLAEPLTMDIDWFFYSPIVGLTDDEVRTYISELREQHLSRVNTMGAPFEDRHPQNARLRIVGPATATCDEPSLWRLDMQNGGTTYGTLFQYRERQYNGQWGPWHPVYQPTLELTPSSSTHTISLSARAQDLWSPHAPTTASNGWQVVHSDNYTTGAQRSISISCP